MSPLNIIMILAAAFSAFVCCVLVGSSELFIVTESFQYQPASTSKKPPTVLNVVGRAVSRGSERQQSSPLLLHGRNIGRRDSYSDSNSKKKNEPLYLFGRNKEGEETDTDTDKDNTGTDANGSSESKSKSGRSIPFFGRLKNRKRQQEQQREQSVDFDGSRSVDSSLNTATVAATATATVEEESKTESFKQQQKTTTTMKVVEKKKEKEAPTPEDLRAMAERARLEAEKLDAELTLAKIEKLEKKLIKTKKNITTTATSESTDEIQYELDVLEAKLRGEKAPVKPTGTTSQHQEKTASLLSSMIETTQPATSASSTTDDNGDDIDDSKVIEAAKLLASADDDNYKFQSEEDLDKIPNFLLKILAAFVGMDVNKIDKKEFLKRWEMTRNLDYSYFMNKTAPTFTSSDVVRKKRQILNSNATSMFAIEEFDSDEMTVITSKMIEKADGNATQLALYALECDYYLEYGGKMLTSVPIDDITPDFVKGLMNESFFGSMYPKCVTARGENEDADTYVSEEPTEAQIDVLTKTILPAVKFSSSSKPLKVPGGYAITGNHKFKTGDELIEAIDNEILKSRPNLQDKLTVLYTPSYGPLNNNFTIGTESLDSLTDNIDSYFQSDALELFADSEPILYVVGPNIVRKPNRIGLSLTSIIGLGTAWYLSVYPFLLNDQIANRVDADLQLIESNLQPDLSYLTDLSIPLFTAFIGLQLIHEAGHALAALSKNVKLSVPVFVPSLITGITSSVTTFKTLPKNKNDMFDISAAGPLAGIVASSVAIAIGAKLTLISDPSTLPALPVNVLRQSTLGGAIIDNVITGSLYVPEGAPTGGINIPLHPLAIAGYTSLLVNALALLPIGTTDGGRLTMALFDRAEKMSIGTLMLGVLLYTGLFGSDLFLFYYSFCIAFQTGNEIPARNEQDSVDFSRVIVAIICYGLAILTLVPFQ